MEARRLAAKRVAVIGAGHIAAFHAEKLAACPDIELAAIVDIDAAAAQRLATRHGVPAHTELAAIFARCDAVVVAVPARAHHSVARACLLAGLDVLIEKPIAVHYDEAQDLLACARRTQRILQVGHVERFNPAIVAIRPYCEDLRRIRLQRTVLPTARNRDVDVVLDLMIHDLDLLLYLSGRTAAEFKVQEVSGDSNSARVCWLTADGFRAECSASRVGVRSVRKLHAFSRSGYLNADLRRHRVNTYWRARTDDALCMTQQNLRGDALAAEIAAFIVALQTRVSPPGAGDSACQALSLALQVQAALQGARSRCYA